MRKSVYYLGCLCLVMLACGAQAGPLSEETVTLETYDVLGLFTLAAHQLARFGLYQLTQAPSRPIVVMTVSVAASGVLLAWLCAESVLTHEAPTAGAWCVLLMAAYVGYLCYGQLRTALGQSPAAV